MITIGDGGIYIIIDWRGPLTLSMYSMGTTYLFVNTSNELRALLVLRNHIITYSFIWQGLIDLRHIGKWSNIRLPNNDV